MKIAAKNAKDREEKKLGVLASWRLGGKNFYRRKKMSNIAVKFENVSKFYKLYNSPKDRLKEALHPFGKKRHREFHALKNNQPGISPIIIGDTFTLEATSTMTR